jgi:hypothetical protein
MSQNIRRAAMAAFMTATMATALTALVPADAAPARNGRQQEKTPPANQVRPVVGKPLQEAQKLADAKDFAGALVKVKEADTAKDKTPFEQIHDLEI